MPDPTDPASINNNSPGDQINNTNVTTPNQPIVSDLADDQSDITNKLPQLNQTFSDPNEAPAPESVVTAPHAPKKYGGKKVIATIFGVLLLVGAVATGVYLVQRQQEIREQAASGRECQQSQDCILLDSPGNSGSYQTPRPIIKVKITDQDVHEYNPGNSDDSCRKVNISENFVSWEKYGSGPDCKDVSNVQIWMGQAEPPPSPVPTQPPTPTPTQVPGVSPTTTPRISPSPAPTTPPGISAQCGEVKAYNTSWILLSANDLKGLQTGNHVRFAVSGTTNGGSFDKARFTINNSLKPEVTTKKPGTNEFYYEYIVPQGTTSFSVKGELHHTSLGWF